MNGLAGLRKTKMAGEAFAKDSTVSDSEPALLTLHDLSVRFAPGVDVLRRVSFAVQRAEIVALVGESGCGKTLTALSVLGLLPAGAETYRGRIELAGAGDLLALEKRLRRDVRARRLAMIFQQPMSALNPVLSLGYQIGESLRFGRRLRRSEVGAEARRLLELVAMPDPERRLESYPHQLSGGQLQRAMIAMALASGPDLLLADEPTTALDVTVQAQVIELLLELRRKLGLAVLLITHDLGVVAQCCDRVVVMYGGQVVEEGPVDRLFSQPTHPYTRALLASVPRLDGSIARTEGIPGRVPEPGSLPTGCIYHPRCQLAFDRCKSDEPRLFTVSDGAAGEPGEDSSETRRSRCWLFEDPKASVAATDGHQRSQVS